MDQTLVAQGADDRGQTACVVEVFHQESPRGHKVRDGWHVSAQTIPIVEAESHTGTARDGEQMDDRVCPPPIAPLTRIAFSNASRVRMREMRKSSRTISTIRRPAVCASAKRRESTAGIAALCGSAKPRASTMEAIVDAVPMLMQCPADRAMQLSAAMKSGNVIVSALTSSRKRHRSVPEPMSLP